jgi:hypothetical protein
MQTYSNLSIVMKENNQEQEANVMNRTISVRVPDDVYSFFEGIARSERRRMTDAVRIVLEDYARGVLKPKQKAA